MRSPWTMATVSVSMQSADDTICSLIHHQTNSIFAALTSIYYSIFIYAIRSEAHNEAVDCPFESIPPQPFSMQNVDYRMLPIFQIQFQVIWIDWNEEAVTMGLIKKQLTTSRKLFQLKFTFDLITTTDTHFRFSLSNQHSWSAFEWVNHFDFQQRITLRFTNGHSFYVTLS